MKLASTLLVMQVPSAPPASSLTAAAKYMLLNVKELQLLRAAAPQLFLAARPLRDAGLPPLAPQRCPSFMVSSPRSAVAWALLLPNSCGLVLSLFASPAEKGKRRPGVVGPGGGGGGGRGSVAPVELLAAEVPNAQLSEAAARPAAAAAPPVGRAARRGRPRARPDHPCHPFAHGRCRRRSRCRARRRRPSRRRRRPAGRRPRAPSSPTTARR